LDLFHEYLHGDINRRTFLDRAGKFAVGGLTVATIFESLRPNYAWAQQVPPADLNAGVTFYGRQASVDDVPKISAPLLQYAGNDQRINEGIPAYEAALKAQQQGLSGLHVRR
jgi:dienelactone hydrolase